MSEHDELGAFVDATRTELERRRSSSAPVPDFAAMFERAHELDPEIVDEATLAHVRELAPVVPLRALSGDHADELEPFRAALREQLDAGVAERRTREIPAPTFIRPRPLVRRNSGRWMVAAAVLLLIGGGVSAMIGADLLGMGEHDGEVARTLASLRLGAQTVADEIVAPELDAPELDAPDDELELEDASEPAPVVEPSPEPVVIAPEPEPERPRKRKRAEESDVDPLAELDARAQALWRAGDLDGAEQLFREIVRRGGRGRWAELAYAELFSLAQRHSGTQREVLWREYLASFPKGRYAEDARAGLCRRATGSERDACWSDYLSRHPEGTHADEARRALAKTEP